MAKSKKTIIGRIKHLKALVKVMARCKDKTDVKRYERLVDDREFLSVQENIDAFMQVMVTDTALWGGDLWLVFLPHESDDEFSYGLGVNTAYNSVIDFLDCGIRESNPVIAWVRNFFACRTSKNQKIDSFCIHALKTSLLPLCNEESMDKLYEVSESVKAIPCEAWGNFVDGFYPFYKKLVEENNLNDVFQS